jgi:hypothetical protein
MTLFDMIKTARLRADDLVDGRLWSWVEWTEYANDAVNEAARRSRLIADSRTAAVCQIALNATDETYDLHDSIIFIKRAKLTGESTPLGRAHSADLDRCMPGWEDETGVPRAYVPNMDSHQFRPYPKADGVYTVNLSVIRSPLVDMEDSEDVPEIAGRHHINLVHWMLHRAYLKLDSETYNPGKAEESLKLFEAEFGKRSTAQDEAWIAREHGFTPEEGVY